MTTPGAFAKTSGSAGEALKPYSLVGVSVLDVHVDEAIKGGGTLWNIRSKQRPPCVLAPNIFLLAKAVV